MNDKKYYLFLCILIIIVYYISACTSEAPVEQTPKPEKRNEPLHHDVQVVMSVLYQQHAAEYRALCLQTYNLAKEKLNKELKKKLKKPVAIVTDLDETALDNSKYYGWLYEHDTTYNPASWNAWCNARKADAVPGSVNFLKYADSKKVQIFYISNRDTSLVNCTMDNMKALGFPQLKKDHFLFRSSVSSKEERRKQVSVNDTIVLLLGDNLNDFTYLFERQKTAERKYRVDSLSTVWGDRFIVLPNAIYGDWENAFYKYNMDLSLQQKDSTRLKLLQGY